ncbi:MAG TPA: GH25 family lysozyme [Tepidisphaeraceae bacterium]|nr:GH25 family lysozyme [Tepidisphaeraceae bacterium]
MTRSLSPARRAAFARPARARAVAAAALVESLEGRLLCARLTGIDVSTFQGNMNWATAKAAGISFAFIRASRTDTLPDPKLAQNMTGSAAQGIVTGVYHRILPFSNTADTGAFVDPIDDADNFIASGGAYMGSGYMRPVVDVENGAKLNTTPVNGYNLSTWTLAFVNRIKEIKGVTPLIYTGHYRSNLNSSVVTALPDLWIANWEDVNYGHPVFGTGGPPTSPWTPSPNWKFWQYDSPNSLGATYGAESKDIDLNVFNGDDIDVLKQNFVIGAPQIPSGPSPVHGSGSVNPVGLVLNWNDSPNATSYDVYLDDMTTPAATNLASSQWTVSPVLTTGTHRWKVVAKASATVKPLQVEGPEWSFTVTGSPVLPAVPHNPFPAEGSFLNYHPFAYDWANSSNATSYDIYYDGAAAPSGNFASSQSNSFRPADGLHTWQVVAKNANGTTSGPTWSYTMDTVAPTATYNNQLPVNAASTFTFTVTYTDATSLVNRATFDGYDITVTGPNGFTANAVFVSATAGNAATRTATYRINSAPGGTWDWTDNGVYTIAQNANEIRDVANNIRAAGTIATFNPSITPPFAYMAGSTLNIHFDGTARPITLGRNGASMTATLDGTTLSFSGATAMTVTASTASDTLNYNNPHALTTTFTGGNGLEAVNVQAGTVTFASNLGTQSPLLNLSVASGATAIFNSTQRINGLSVAGTATLAAGGGKVLVVKNLSVAGRLDLADNDLVWDYTGPTKIGAWLSGQYTDAQGLIATGRQGGSWAGNGLVTTRPAALTGATTLAAAEAMQIVNFNGNPTATWNGQAIDQTAVLIKYTYAGDADLNGKINGDDYFVIDARVGQSPAAAPAYAAGDFEYNGRIDADDYFVIDRNIGRFTELL